LKDVLKTFTQNNITNWCNSTIGHGALKFEDDREFQKDMEQMIRLVKTHFDNNSATYNKLRLIYSTGEEEINLSGKDLARNLEYPPGQLCLDVDGARVDLYPFIILKDRGVYFYDTYLTKKERSISFPAQFKLPPTP